MAGFVAGIERDQATLSPAQLNDGIAEDHLVRVADLFVDGLDLAGLGFARSP